MEYTKNYHLPQWAESDRIMMEDFNQAMAEIEAGLETVKNEAETGKAEVVETLHTQMAAVMANLGAAGTNLRVCTGSYVGTGTYGAENPSSLTFDFQPLLVLFCRNDSSLLYNSRLVWPCIRGESIGGGRMAVTWGNKTVSWYTAEAMDESLHQNNDQNAIFYYTAFGYDDNEE